jgi:hypothetical protein
MITVEKEGWLLSKRELLCNEEDWREEVSVRGT